MGQEQGTQSKEGKDRATQDLSGISLEEGDVYYM